MRFFLGKMHSVLFFFKGKYEQFRRPVTPQVPSVSAGNCKLSEKGGGGDGWSAKKSERVCSVEGDPQNLWL